MNRAALTGLGCFAVFVVASGATLEPITIKRTAVKGQKIPYAMTGKISVAGMDMEISSKQVDTIVDVAADGTYTTESLQSDMQFNGMPSPQQPSGPTKSVNKPTGELLSITSPDGGADVARLASLTQFYYPTKPVEVNDSWTFEGKKDDKLGTVDFKADMKYLGEEMVGTTNTWKVQEDVKEATAGTPAVLHSTVWLDKTDGSMVKATSNFTDLPVTGGFSISGTMSFTKS